MAELNNNELDDLFKEGSELHQFSYRADAWDSMDGMLDQQVRRKRMLLFLLFFCLCALIIGGFYFYSNKYSSQTAATDHTIAKSAIIQQSSSNDLEDNSAIKISESKENLDTKTNEIVGNNNNNNNNNTKSSAASKSVVGNNDITVNTQKAKTLKPLSFDNQLSNKDNSIISVQPKNASSKVAQNNTIVNATVEAPINLIPSLQHFLDPIQDQPIATSFFEKEHIFPIKTALTNATEISPWSFGLSVGPEISLVGKKMKPKLGYSVGIEVAYQLSNKFSLKTGVGYSAKNYVGSGADYSTPDGFWTDDIQPITVEATCQVFEVPFAISYFKNGMNNSGFFADLGINAYLIGDEWYDYNYDPAINNPSLRLSFTEQMSNKRVLGSVQFSFGYQKYVSENWRLQIAPYTKIPLNGFGHGQVKLFSSGIKFSAWFTK